MKLGIMQPYFFPYIGYWQLMNAVDTYVVYDDVNYINRGWINRNRILVAKKPQYINLNLSGASQNKLINEIELSKDLSYVQKIFRTLELNYKKAPYYHITMDLIDKILNNPQTNLAIFLFDQIQLISRYLEIDTKLILSSSISKNNSLHGENKILEICHCLKANIYYNAIGGKTLYSKENFENRGIALKFLETDDIYYKQFGENFFDNLSIIDVMMFNSKEKINTMLKQYHII
ncbi:MAG: WbqC family protein [Hungatella sp.]|nr:WbqC family protein [Hungatella sp.]